MNKEAAAELGRKRWKGTSKKERSEAMSNLAMKLWANMPEEERKAHGARLAAARAKKAGKAKKKPANVE